MGAPQTRKCDRKLPNDNLVDCQHRSRKTLEATKQDITVAKKKRKKIERSCHLIDLAISAEHNDKLKQIQKLKKFSKT